MGKMTGFLDYGREVSAETAARDRIKNWNEFHTPLSGEEQRNQVVKRASADHPLHHDA